MNINYFDVRSVDCVQINELKKISRHCKAYSYTFFPRIICVGELITFSFSTRRTLNLLHDAKLPSFLCFRNVRCQFQLKVKMPKNCCLVFSLIPVFGICCCCYCFDVAPSFSCARRLNISFNFLHAFIKISFPVIVQLLLLLYFDWLVPPLRAMPQCICTSFSLHFKLIKCLTRTMNYSKLLCVYYAVCAWHASSKWVYVCRCMCILIHTRYTFNTHSLHIFDFSNNIFITRIIRVSVRYAWKRW